MSAPDDTTPEAPREPVAPEPEIAAEAAGSAGEGTAEPPGAPGVSATHATATGAVPSVASAASVAPLPHSVPIDPPTPHTPPALSAAPTPPTARAQRPGRLAEPPDVPIEVPRRRLQAQSRRDFLLFGLGLTASAVGAWWLLPDRTRARLLPGGWDDRLDTLASRTGLSRHNRERVLDRALSFDDDIAEALYSKNRRVRTYTRSQVTPLRNNYDGQTPGPEYLPGWRLSLSGLASGTREQLSIETLLARFTLREQITRLVCVEGWSAVAWWGGIRFADLLAAYPPQPGARWAAMRSAVNLDGRGRPDPYFVSIDLGTAQHPQALLATHQNGEPLSLAHGAPMRLLVPMKLGLKNIKAVTEIEYTVAEPRDYWNERGYSRYDGL